jgi:hypothetical protein
MSPETSSVALEFYPENRPADTIPELPGTVKTLTKGAVSGQGET